MSVQRIGIDCNAYMDGIYHAQLQD